MHAVFFYPLVAIASAAAIAASFNYALTPPEPAAQTAQITEKGFRFNAEQLSHIDPGSDQYLYPIRELIGPIEAVQLATKRRAGEPSPAVQGARLTLTPETAQALSGKALKVSVWVRPLSQNAAQTLSVSLQSAGPAEWVTKPMPSTEARVSFVLPATTDLQAIGFWPQPGTGDYYDYYGVEIVDVRVESAS